MNKAGGTLHPTKFVVLYPKNIRKVKTPTEEVETPTEVDDFKNAIAGLSDPLLIQNFIEETLSEQDFKKICCQTFTYNKEN